MAGLAEIRRIASLTTPRRPSAYPLYPDLGSRLPTFHDEPELFGGHSGRLRMSATVRTVFGISNLAAVGSTVTGTLRSIPSRQARTASMSSGVKSIWG